MCSKSPANSHDRYVMYHQERTIEKEGLGIMYTNKKILETNQSEFFVLSQYLLYYMTLCAV
jgi:hypothetical protein